MAFHLPALARPSAALSLAVTLTLTLSSPLPARAQAMAPGPASPGAVTVDSTRDPVGTCFVRQTTPAERAGLVRWVFAMAALNPSVRDVASVSDAQRDRLNRDTAALVQHLLTASCRSQTTQALRNEGLPALQRSFQTLAQVAIQELFGDARVAAGIAGMVPYLDLPSLLELGADLR